MSTCIFASEIKLYIATVQSGLGGASIAGGTAKAYLYHSKRLNKFALVPGRVWRVLQNLAEQQGILHNALYRLEEQHADRHHATRAQLRVSVGWIISKCSLPQAVVLFIPF